MTLGTTASSILKYKVTDWGGGAQYVEVGDVAPFDLERTDSFSWMVWVKWTDPTLASYLEKLPNPGTNPERGYDLYLFNGKWGFTLKHTDADLVVRESSALYNDGKWHQLVATYDGSSTAAGVKLYVDGALIASVAVNDTLTDTIDNTESFRIGSRPATGWGLVGDAGDVALYLKELSAAEVTAIYAKGCPPNLLAVGPTGDLAAYYLNGAHVGQPALEPFATAFPTVPDASGGGNDGTMTNMLADQVVTRV